MKKGLSYLLIFAMLIAVSVPVSDTSAAKKFKVGKKQVTVREQESVKVKYTSAKKPKAVSKNKKIAKVAVKKKIIITGVKKGKTKIVVKASGKSATIKVTVKKAPKVVESSSPTPKPTADPAIKEALKKLSGYAEPVNKFTYETYSGVRKGDGNTFVSPFSLYMALSMLVNGADSNTKTELLNALGISDLNDWNSKVKVAFAGSSDEMVDLSVANAAWIGNNFPVSPTIDKDFIDPIKEYYGSEIKKNVDMASQETVKDINNWADEKTKGMIKEVIKEPLPADTAMLLANAVYFFGEWKSPFREANTSDKDFNGVKGKKKVPMMAQWNITRKYIKDDKFVGAELEYGSGNYVMDILMSSDTSTTAGKVWESLSAEEQAAEMASFANKQYKTKINYLELPKFEFEKEYSAELIEILGKMGVNDVFDPTKSDLSKIGNGLFVSTIRQNTKLKVNEKGTEAAAVTTITLPMAAAPSPQEERIEFIVDRPFIFAIRDTVSGMILFIGEVNDL